jgi:transcription initiation factor IIE alpha subunit
MDEMMEEKLYVCPMHPDETSNKPGTCPICGMDLVLMEDIEEMEETEESDM